MEGVLPLMEVDRILDGWKEVRDERTELNQIKALIEVDQEVDRARTIMEAKKQKKESDIELDRIMLDLLRVDMECDRARGHKEEKHELKDICDLLAVDLLVDSLKHHTKKKDLDQIISNPLTYQFPPPPPQKHSLRDVQDLLKVDEFIDGKKHKASIVTELGDLADLYKVDQEIDAARAALALVSAVKPSASNSKVGQVTNKQENVANTAAPTTTAAPTAPLQPPKKRSIFSVKEKEGASTKSAIAPGTTAVISAKCIMIGDIPVANTVPTATTTAPIDPVLANNPYAKATVSTDVKSSRNLNRGRSSRKSIKGEKSGKDKCAIM